MNIENHMRELMEQARAGLPADPNNNDVINSILGGNTDATNKAGLELDEFKLRQVVKVAEVFRECRGRLPRSYHELLADPVCKKMADAQEKALADAFLAAIKSIK